MNAVYKVLPHYTYADYCNWEGRWEIIEGIPYAMSPLPNIRHQRISGNLYAAFRAALETKNCSCEVVMPVDYKIAEDTVVQPDLLIICPPVAKGNFITEAPQLVVEVLSPSTAMKDRNNKYIIYEAQKIPYYLIADPAKDSLEIYELNKDGKYILLPEQSVYQLSFKDGCSIEADFSNIWV